MAKAKILKDADVEKLLESDRPDGLIIISSEDKESISATIKHLRGEIDKLKGKDKK